MGKRIPPSHFSTTPTSNEPWNSADADFAAFCCFSPFLASRPWVRIYSMLIDGSGILPGEMVTGFVKQSTGMAGASPAACNWLHKDS